MQSKKDYVHAIKAILKNHQKPERSIFYEPRMPVSNYLQGNVDFWKKKYEELKNLYEGKASPGPIPKVLSAGQKKIQQLKKEVRAMIKASPLKVEDFDLPSHGSLKRWEELKQRVPVAIERVKRKITKKEKKIKKQPKRQPERKEREEKVQPQELEIPAEPVVVTNHMKFKKGSSEDRVYSTDDVKHDVFRFVEKATPVIVDFLITKLDEMKFKTKVCIQTTMSKGLEDLTYASPLFWSEPAGQMAQVTNVHQIPGLVNEMLMKCNDEMEKFINNGSGWTLESVDFIGVNTSAFNPFKAASYLELPTKVKNSKSCINIKNLDNMCFKWCILRHLHPVAKDAEKPGNLKQYENDLDFTGIDFPVSVKDIKKFSELNNIGVRVFGWDKNLFPIFQTPKYENMVNLLLIEDSDTDNKHYVLIKSFSRLMGYKKNNNAVVFCMNCFQNFGSEELLEKHETFGCLDHKEAFAVLPKAEKAHITFKNYKKQLKHPVVIYADFEASTVPVNIPNGQCTTAYQKHKCVSYGYKIQSDYPKLNKPFKSFRAKSEDDNVINHFMTSLMKDAQEINTIIQQCTPMIMTPEEEQSFQEAKDCHICGKTLGRDRVRDHDHVNGLYRGPAHNLCNKHYTIKLGYKVPVFFHNLRGYDSHFIMEEITKFCTKLDCIPNTMDKYIAFSTEILDFKDSAQFMMASLESLAKSVPKNLLKCMKQEFKGLEEERFNMLLQKGIYPYDYMNCVAKFDEKELPPQAEFYSKLNDEDVSAEDYQRAQLVWNAFEMKDLGDYHDLYLKTDVCLLADIFENFRNVCMNIYKLDPAHYYTAPSLSWDSMLKFTNITLDTFNDEQYNMQLFIENGMRGGVSTITHRYAKANNKYMESYKSEEKSSYITYLDANNLYGYAMSQSLPKGDYKWNEDTEWTVERIMNLQNDDLKGYIFQVDLTYPIELHNLHNDYPLAPESRHGQLSPFMAQIKAEANVMDASVKKLVPTLNDKKNYVLHYRNLQQCLSLGMRLTKVHQVLEFSQSKWLEAYIMKNTIERTKAKTDFEKDFYKLMNNSIFGKTMENVRRRIKVNLVTNDEQALKLTRKCNVSNFKIFNENLMAIQRKHDQVLFNKPTIVGMCILDLSKTLMYDFHYNVVKAKYGDRARLCFTDTDSLCYHIETEDLYQDFSEQKSLYDLSGYSKEFKMTNGEVLHDSTNKKVIGKFKDETEGVPIVEFVGLRAKMYSNLLENGNMKKTAKGIKKGFMKKHIKHENYKAAIFDKTQMRQTAEFNLIRARNHKLHSITVKKVGLCCFDDKRYVLEDNIHTLAHGHYLTNAN